MNNEFKVPFDLKPKVVVKKNEVNDKPVEGKSEIATDEISIEKIPEPVKLTTNCPYVRPKWSSKPDDDFKYSFEVLKSGQIIENLINLQTKEFWAIGKLPDNDIIMNHPTISRYHAVIQYRPNINANDSNSDDDSDNDDDEETEKDIKSKNSKPKIEKGWYLYDLNSTHGSYVNKMRVPSKTYIRVRVGHMLKFGASTRSYILQGPEFDEEAESELSVTEIKQLRIQKEHELKEKIAAEEKRKESEGVSWGMTDDAEEETDLSYNPYAMTTNEELFLDDPKKTLRGYFEREGYDLNYNLDELSPGSYICKVELPIDDAMGNSIIAEFRHKGKKKDCVVQCAMEACRILDRHGVLRQSHHEPQRKRKAKNSDDDDDDDEFYDRTRDAEEKRKQKSGQNENNVMTYDQLCEEELKIMSLIKECEEKITKYQEQDKIAKQRKQNEEEDLDDFMSNLSSEKELDKTEIKKLRFELQRLTGELTKTKRLINITKPVEMPALKATSSSTSSEKPKKSIIMPLFGKKRTFGLGKPTAKPLPKVARIEIKTNDDNVEEFDEDDEPDIDKGQKTNETIALEQSTLAMNVEVSNEKINENVTDKSHSRTKTDIIKIESNAKNKIDTIIDPPTEPEQEDSTEKLNELKEKKKRNRNRIRNDRNRDIDAECIETEEPLASAKYSKWIPPENQTGDGYTDLNAKYGY